MGQFSGAVTQSIGAVISAVGQVEGAYYQAAVLRNNAMIAKSNARIKMAEGQRAEEAARLRTGMIMGSQKAAFAGGNIDVASGSVGDVLANTAMLGELDALTLRYNAESESLNFKNEARALSSQANQTITAGWINATTTLLSGSSSVSDKWMQFEEAGGEAAGSSGASWAAAIGGG